MCYVHPALKRAIMRGLFAMVTSLLVFRGVSAQEESEFRFERQTSPRSTTGLVAKEPLRLDTRLNPIRTPDEQDAFEAHRKELRLRAQQRIRTDHPGRVRAPYSGERAASKAGAITVFTVNTDFDDPDENPGDGVCYDGFQQNSINECSLRAAIQEANLTPGTDQVVIRIDMISDARGFTDFVAYNATNDLWTLLVNNSASHDTYGVLPPITRNNVLIDGTTQLDGSGVGSFPDAYCGQPVLGDTSIVKVAIDGSVTEGANDVGLDIQADNVEIRGIAVKNFPGNGIFASGAENLKIECSYLGTDHFARTAEPNGSNGLAEQGGSGFVMKNSIASGNMVSGVVAGSPGASVDSSFFGLDVTGLEAIGNAATGLYVTGDAASVTAIFASGNDDGLWFVGNNSDLTNSAFGVGLDWMTPVPNDAGIRINGDGNSVGGPAGMHVLASGNTTYGIFLAAEAAGNVIAGTIVGANLAGDAAIPNQTGIQDSGAGNLIGEPAVPGAPGLTDPVAGKTTSLATVPPTGAWSNLISGNSNTGILATSMTDVRRNYIGTDSLGTSALPNGVYGIYLLNGSNHQIGNGPSEGNLISGNGNVGLYIGPLATNADVAANYIGTDVTGASPLPNGAEGIRVDAGGTVVIGGDASSENLIAHNTGAGIRVEGTGSTDIAHNRIFDNGGIGIDLDGDGVTPNDGGTPPDTDSGPNGLQNFPVINDAIQTNPTTVTVSSDLASTPSTQFRFDYYRSDSPDGSGNGEGAIWVKTHSASTNASGNLGLDIGFTPAELPLDSWVTVTATSPSGKTSEFSNAVQVTGSGIALTGSKVFLEGPFAGGSMATTLLSEADVPLSQPYAAATFNGTLQEFDASVSVAEIPATTVDWVVLSLRSDTDASSEVQRTVAFVKSDGSLVHTSGVSSIPFSEAGEESYYLVVCHRNHLCAMSSAAIDFSSGSGSWDFTTGIGQAYTGGGAPMKALSGGVFGLFAADSNVDGQITAPDFNQWIAETTAGQTGYRGPDHNLDGQVTAPDFNLWIANTTAGASSQVP